MVGSRKTRLEATVVDTKRNGSLTVAVEKRGWMMDPGYILGAKWAGLGDMLDGGL